MNWIENKEKTEQNYGAVAVNFKGHKTNQLILLKNYNF